LKTYQAWLHDTDSGETVNLGVVGAADFLQASATFRERLEGAGLDLLPPVTLEVRASGEKPTDLKWRAMYISGTRIGKIMKKPADITPATIDDAMSYVDSTVNVEAV
jgi:hypothetical protein